MYTGIIYKAVSPSKKAYYGKTARTLDIRIDEHNTKSKIEKNKHFYIAIRKYGITNFNWETVEIIERKTKNELSDVLNEKEKYYIKKEKTYLRENGYNMTLGGDGAYGLKRTFSEDHKRKLSEAHKGKILSIEHRKKISESETGRVFSEDVRKKLSFSKKGTKNPNYGKTTSATTKKKLSISSKNVKKVICLHCGKEFTPWGIVHHNKKINKLKIR